MAQAIDVCWHAIPSQPFAAMTKQKEREAQDHKADDKKPRTGPSPNRDAEMTGQSEEPVITDSSSADPATANSSNADTATAKIDGNADPATIDKHDKDQKEDEEEEKTTPERRQLELSPVPETKIEEDEGMEKKNEDKEKKEERDDEESEDIARAPVRPRTRTTSSTLAKLGRSSPDERRQKISFYAAKFENTPKPKKGQTEREKQLEEENEKQIEFIRLLKEEQDEMKEDIEDLKNQSYKMNQEMKVHDKKLVHANRREVDRDMKDHLEKAVLKHFPHWFDDWQKREYTMQTLERMKKEMFQKSWNELTGEPVVDVNIPGTTIPSTMATMTFCTASDCQKMIGFSFGTYNKNNPLYLYDPKTNGEVYYKGKKWIMQFVKYQTPTHDLLRYGLRVAKQIIIDSNTAREDDIRTREADLKITDWRKNIVVQVVENMDTAEVAILAWDEDLKNELKTRWRRTWKEVNKDTLYEDPDEFPHYCNFQVLDEDEKLQKRPVVEAAEMQTPLRKQRNQEATGKGENDSKKGEKGKGKGKGQYKTALCHYHEQGNCRRGEHCTFAHGWDDLKRW